MTAGAAYPEFEQNLGRCRTTSPPVICERHLQGRLIFGGAQEYTKAFKDKYKKEPTYLGGRRNRRLRKF